MSIYEKFNKKIDTKGLVKDAKEVEENGSSFDEISAGEYEVAIDKIELKETKKGDPMLSIWFKIIEGKNKGSIIFYNQVLTSGFGIHNALQFLRSMDIGIEINFNDFVQFGALLEDIAENYKDKLEFILEYGVNSKGYNTYKINEVFEN